MAHALGARVTLLTALSPGFDRACLAGLDVRPSPAAVLPRYANSYDGQGDRTQLLLEPGDPLRIPSGAFEQEPDVLLVAPAYHEFEACPPIAARFTGIDLQGPLRTTHGVVVKPHPNPRAAAQPFVREGDFVFFSEEDTPDADGLARYVASLGATVLLTRGYRGATLFSGGTQRQLSAIPANPIDPTGAGDCFATAFMVRLAETDDIEAACSFGLAAGALAVEGFGIGGIPTREQIEQRLAREAA
ncbi:MAG: hypothetical protein C0506_01345 [Anaerolinea sp.]|nr:hypothetical protein [Anaerolinea sp.]